MELTERTWQIMQLARDEAFARGDAHVGTDHVLLAMLRDGTGAAACLLNELGVTYDDVEGRIHEAFQRTSHL